MNDVVRLGHGASSSWPSSVAAAGARARRRTHHGDDDGALAAPGVVSPVTGAERRMVDASRSEREPLIGEDGRATAVARPPTAGRADPGRRADRLLIALTIALFGTDATGGPLQVALLPAPLVAGLVAFKNGYTAAAFATRPSAASRPAMGAIFILLAVGALIGTWNMAGTIPTVVYYGIGLLSATWFYPATAIICGLVGPGHRQLVDHRRPRSVSPSSRWRRWSALDPVIAAGAVISGAYFGDKMTPHLRDDGPRALASSAA